MIVLPSQRNAQVIRDRLMNGKPPSFRSKIVEIRRQIAAEKPVQITRPNRDRMPNWRRIVFEVSEKHQVSYADIVGGVRVANVVQARDEAAWRIKYETVTSFPQIGDRLGGMDHSSIIRAIERHEERINA